jgi:hypothetical protein
MKNQVMLIFLFVILALAACSNASQTDLHLTEQQLANAGYYAYVLPERYETDLHWSQDIHIYSFNVHCTPVSSSEFFNPVNISYKDEEDNPVLTVSIAPDYEVWDRRKTTTSITLESEWVSDKEGEYYLTDVGTIALKFTDVLDMEVVVFSSFELGNLTEVIEQLQYMGPNIDDVGNPWLAACE